MATAGTAVEDHHGGLNSATWFVTDGGRRWIAKAVAPGARRSFTGGLTVAARDSCGVIDWSTAMFGPLLYDLASAVMYVGGPDRAGMLIARYLAQGWCQPPRPHGRCR